MTEENYNTERDRGILTPADREYLIGNNELSDQSERRARMRIRNRLTNGLLDLELALTEMEQKDVEMVMSKVNYDDLEELEAILEYLKASKETQQKREKLASFGSGSSNVADSVRDSDDNSTGGSRE